MKKAIDNVYEEYDGYDPHDLSRFAERVDEEIDNAPSASSYMAIHDKMHEGEAE